MVERNWPAPFHRCRGTIHSVLEAIEPFGRPPAVISVSLAVWLFTGPRRGVSLRILVGALGSGLCVDVLKMIVARVRPRNFDFQGTAADTFHSFLPGPFGSSQLQSWPSGHTATAVGFCLALSTVFPRGSPLFISMAALVALQRIESCAHFLSDTLFAAALAYGLWIVVFGSGRFGQVFARFESWAGRG
jgi:membrane-associated phospholipid phosphatase